MVSNHKLMNMGQVKDWVMFFMQSVSLHIADCPSTSEFQEQIGHVAHLSIGEASITM